MFVLKIDGNTVQEIFSQYTSNSLNLFSVVLVELPMPEEVYVAKGSQVKTVSLFLGYKSGVLCSEDTVEAVDDNIGA